MIGENASFPIKFGLASFTKYKLRVWPPGVVVFMFSFTITNCHEDLQVYDFSASQLTAFALQPRPKDVILSAESWQHFCLW